MEKNDMSEEPRLRIGQRVTIKGRKKRQWTIVAMQFCDFRPALPLAKWAYFVGGIEEGWWEEDLETCSPEWDQEVLGE